MMDEGAGVTDTSGSMALTYDARGNVVLDSRAIDAIVYDTAYAYDLADRPTQITHPSGRIVAYQAVEKVGLA